MKVYLNEQITDEKDAKISVLDHGFLYGDAVFESLRYENNEILNLKEHIQRLKHSAKVMQLSVPDIPFKEIILELVQENNLAKARIRITLSRGISSYNFNTCNSPTLLIATVPFQEKRKDFYKGSKTCTLQMERPVPGIKTTQILPSILAQQKMHK
ncbi:branched-chain amino acid aminotransferase, partial [Candidatus Peregrinibacteria bacterium]|nr:branched-chain amino acid aminotransferase [Candidatus Peregrinibacteria bacterium]